jgi:hypothetical protein
VKEPPFLIAMDRIIGGIKIEDDLPGGLVVRLYKQRHEQIERTR